MKAAYIEQPGPPENIAFGDLPKPKPGDGQVLVRVKAVAVNPVDTYIRAGMYPMDLPRPFIVGCDLAGVVEAVGPARRSFALATGSGGATRGRGAVRGRSPNMPPLTSAGSILRPRKFPIRTPPPWRWWALRPTWVCSATHN